MTQRILVEIERRYEHYSRHRKMLDTIEAAAAERELMQLHDFILALPPDDPVAAKELADA